MIPPDLILRATVSVVPSAYYRTRVIHGSETKLLLKVPDDSVMNPASNPKLPIRIIPNYFS